MRKLFLFAVCWNLCYSMEMPEGKFLAVIKERSREKLRTFLLDNDAISHHEFNQLTRYTTNHEWHTKERFWFRYGIYFVIHARFHEESNPVACRGKECVQGLQKLDRIIEKKFLDKSALADAQKLWNFLLIHQPLAKSEQNLQEFLKKLWCKKDRGDSARMAYLLTEGLAAEQERVRLKWVSFIRKKNILDTILKLADGCARREKMESHDYKSSAYIDKLVSNLKRFLTSGNLRRRLEIDAKKQFLK